MRGARLGAGLQRLAEQDLGEPALARHADGVAAPSSVSTSAAPRTIIGTPSSRRVTGWPVTASITGSPSSSSSYDVTRPVPDDAGAQVELGRVGVAVGAGVGAAVARPERRDVLAGS